MPRKSSAQLLAELAATNDGLVSKPVGIWSLEKLATLLLYFQAFTSACKSVGGGYYIDGLAGPGICKVRNARPLPYFAWGSPLLALRTFPEFQRCMFIELGGGNSASLRQRIGGFGNRAEVIPGDVNLELPRLLREVVPPHAPCFCLLDQQGTEVLWTTLEAVAATARRKRKPELLILFPLRMSLLRLLTTTGRVSESNRDQISASFGTLDFMEIYEGRVSGRLTAAEAQQQYLALYEERIRGLGYRWVRSKPISAPKAYGMRPQEMYHLIFATDHQTGDKIMQDVFERPYVLHYPVSAQPSLFE